MPPGVQLGVMTSSGMFQTDRTPVTDPLAEERGWLGEYVEGRSQAAYAKLVGRYSGLVYSAAVRQTRGDRHLAEDVTQAVFLVLATRAARIRPGVVLASWLLVVARYAAGDALKAQARRRRREGKAAIPAAATTMNPVDQSMTNGADPWQAIAPELDAALASLREKDRHAIVLRYLQGHSVEEVAAMLGASPAAAKQRIHRAVERLRDFFQARGVTGVSAAAIGPMLLSRAIQPAPPSLIHGLLAASAKAGASAGIVSIAKGAVITMAWTKAKAALLAGGAILLVAGGTAVAVGAFHRPPPHIVVVQN